MWFVAQCGPGKADPWRKRSRPRKARASRALWPAEFWGRLVDAAKKDCSSPAITDECVRMIGDQNELLYGYR